MNSLEAVELDMMRNFRPTRLIAATSSLLVAAGVLTACGFGSRNEAPNSNTDNAPAVMTTEVDLVKQNWQYMPGVSQSADALRVSPTDFHIVSQISDGTAGQANPPVNLYGTHVETATNQTNFTVTATLTDSTADASLQLYDTPPLIADEFRIEPASIRLTETPGDLAVQVYRATKEGDQVTPTAETKHYKLSTKDGVALSVTKKAGQLVVTANGSELPSIPAPNIFNSGNIWFGLDSSGGNFKVKQFAMRALDGGKLAAIDTTKAPVISKNGGLQQLTAQKRTDLPIGAAVNLESIVVDPTYVKELFANFGSMTPENLMKMQNIEPQPGNYQFKYLDALVDIAKKQHMRLHGHTLVFSEALPLWVRQLPADQRQTTMNDYIKTVMTRYKGVFKTVDVVNEPLADYDQFDADTHVYRDNVWNEAATDKVTYMAQALRSAHAADPSAKLGVNEYGLEQSGERRDAMLTLVRQLKAQGVPLDYIGIQAHVYDADSDAINTTDLSNFIDQLAKLSVKTRISELDVTDDAGSSFQNQQFARVFAACLATNNCIGWTTWGVDDNHDFFQDDDGSLQSGHDLLFNNGRPIDAVQTIKQLLRK